MKKILTIIICSSMLLATSGLPLVAAASYVDQGGNVSDSIPIGCVITGTDSSGNTTINCSADPFAPVSAPAIPQNVIDTNNQNLNTLQQQNLDQFSQTTGNQLQQQAVNQLQGDQQQGPQGCPGSGGGGGLSNAVGQLPGGLTVNDLQKINLSVNPDGSVTSTVAPSSNATVGAGQSNIGGVATNIPSSGISLSGLSGVIGKLTGNSVAGQAISALLSGNFSGLASGLLGSAGGLLSGSGLSSLLGGSGLGSLLGGSGISSLLGGSGLGSLLGGGLGGVLGIAGGVLGGGAVPVDTVTANPLLTTGNKQTLKIQSDQDTQLHVTCVDNVMVRQAANDFAAKDVQAKLKDANTGNGGGPRFVQNISQENATLGDTVFSDFVNNQLPNTSIDQTALPKVQDNLVKDRSAKENPTYKCTVPNGFACSQDRSNCGSTPEERIQNYYEVWGPQYYQCTEAGLTKAASSDEAGQETSRIADRNALIQAGQGILPPITCADDNSASVPPDYKCVNYKVVSAPAVTTRTITDAVALGAQKQATANEIGNLVNSMFAQLAQQALTSLTGMLGLSQNSSNGNGSYLDQAANGTSAAAFAQAQTALRGDVENSIVTELSYEGVLNDMLNNLNAATAAITTAKNCFATSTLAAIGSSTPQILTAQASTTIATVLNPQIAQKNQELTNSEVALSQLQNIDTQIQNAQSIADLNALDQEYQALLSSGAIHTVNDLSFLTSDRDASKATLAGMVLSSNASLALCQSQ